MRLLLILILITLISCAENKKQKQDIEVKPQDTVSIVKETVKLIDAIPFTKSIENIEPKSIPLIDDTNFDSFIDEADVYKVDEKLFKLEELYPNFYKEGYNFKAIDAYRIELSVDYLSFVITVKKGDNEMESTLINYDLKGNIIDYQVVAYDEIAEGMFRTQSKITESQLIIHQVAWREEPQIEQLTYSLTDKGEIDALDTKVLNNELQNIPLLLLALEDLKLNLLNIKTDLVVSKSHPDNPDDFIFVIPEIIDEGDDYFELNSHVLIINSRSGEVMQKITENGLLTEAMMLKTIKIDTAPYIISENKRAFGIRVYRSNALLANPYENEMMSLFIKSDDTLNKVLSNYDVMDYGGERVDDCEGEYQRITNVLILLTTKTNGSFDIQVKSEIVDTESFLDVDGICNATDKHSTQTKLLKFNGKHYE